MIEKNKNNYNPAVEESLKRQAELEKYALENGYSYLIIPYWTENDGTYKNLIDNKIQEVLNNQNKKI